MLMMFLKDILLMILILLKNMLKMLLYIILQKKVRFTLI